MIADSTLRELGAATRTFKGVQGAVLWYRDQLARRLSVSRGFEPGTIPCSAEARSRTQATFAAIGRGIGPTHPCDAYISSPALQAALPLTGERISFLVAWYENTYGNGEDLAAMRNQSRWTFTRWCKITERVLRHRFELAGLLEEET